MARRAAYCAFCASPPGASPPPFSSGAARHTRWSECPTGVCGAARAPVCKPRDDRDDPRSAAQARSTPPRSLCTRGCACDVRARTCLWATVGGSSLSSAAPKLLTSLVESMAPDSWSVVLWCGRMPRRCAWNTSVHACVAGRVCIADSCRSRVRLFVSVAGSCRRASTVGRPSRRRSPMCSARSRRS